MYRLDRFFLKISTDEFLTIKLQIFGPLVSTVRNPNFEPQSSTVNLFLTNSEFGWSTIRNGDFVFQASMSQG